MSAPPKLLPGDPAPWFVARSSVNPQHRFDRVAGTYVVMTFIGQAVAPETRALINGFLEGVALFDGLNARWFIVTADADANHLPLRDPGVRAFFDTDGAIRALYGVPPADAGPASFVLSPRLQVIAAIHEPDPGRHAGLVLAIVKAQPPPARLARLMGPPPILVIPAVFEPAFCRMLIEGYARNGGEKSGFMVDEKGLTTQKFNDKIKVRRDWIIEDPQLSAAIGARFQRRVVPEIRKAYNVHIKHMERHLVGCYDASDGGHFSPHRDNEALGAAHRQFACSLNLNAGDYEGGSLSFPEFGPETYTPPTGGCAIFSCSLLHAANRVTSGARYAFLPFLHDDAGEAIRQKNFRFLAPQDGKAHAASNGAAGGKA